MLMWMVMVSVTRLPLFLLVMVLPGYVAADCDDAQLLYADLDSDTYGAGAPVACGVASNN
jgi:hypothetical protein